MNEERKQELAAIAERLSYFGLEGRAQDAITELLGEVNRLQKEAHPVDETMWVPVSEYAKVRRQLAEYQAQANYIAGIIDSEGKYVP